MNQFPTCETCGTRLISAGSTCAFGHRQQRRVATPPPIDPSLLPPASAPGGWAAVDPNGRPPGSWAAADLNGPQPGAWPPNVGNGPPPAAYGPPGSSVAPDVYGPPSAAYGPTGSSVVPGVYGPPAAYGSPGPSVAPGSPPGSWGADPNGRPPVWGAPGPWGPVGPNGPPPPPGAPYPVSWGQQPAPGWPAGWAPQPAPSAGPRRSRLLATALIVTVLGLVGMALLIEPGPDGPPHPDAWDPRVADIAAFVEVERELTFDEPVFVDFLTPEQYRAAATADEPTATEEDKALEHEANDQFVGSLRALGLLEGAPDMDQASDDMSDGGTLAYYTPETERITVRGTEMTLGLQVTLAHELTHALQDQHFDLVRMYDMASVQADDFRAVIEGDAQRVEQVYVEEELDEAETTAYDAESQAASDEGEAATDETVPDIVMTSFASPYILGGAFIELLFQLEGNAGVDRALETPPTSDAQLFDPFRFLSPTDPLEVDVPEPVNGGKVVDEGEFGATNLYLLLASRIDAGEALTAVDGWGGDAMVLSESDGEVCMQVAVQGTNAETTVQLGAALTRWSEAMPGDKDHVDAGDGAGPVRITACDPGADVALAVVPDATRILNLPSFRTYMAAETIEYRGFREAEADCAGDDIVTRVDLDQLDDWGTLFDDPAFTQTFEQVLVACEI